MSTHYTGGQRRALNQIWNGAGAYGFEPLFLSLDSRGNPNFYLNIIVGCVRKWYGEEEPARLFDAWAGDRRHALLDDLAWLFLESAVFSLELSERPVLEELRREHALDFFAREQTLSRQEWMAKNQLSYTMQSARWKAVLGKKPPLMTPYERRLSDALDPGGLKREEVFLTAMDVFARFRLFNGGGRAPLALRFHLKGRWAGVMLRLMPKEVTHTDVASAGRGAGAGEGDGEKLSLRAAKILLKENAASDRSYIESCFGPSLLPVRELAMAEQKLCTGVHEGCHLWYTAGVPTPEKATGGEARQLARQALLQEERNRLAFTGDSALYRNAVRRLTERIQNELLVYAQPEEETARTGRLDGSRVWRAAVLSDYRVFEREADTPRPGFSVDLLLDASTSRMHCQETVAAQGYILAESLSRCGVPVRVSGFCSLRGYTILRVFKSFQGKSRDVFRYFASGWNRDGLALRAAGELLFSAPGEKRLLLLLTEANPSDSHRIAPGEKYPFGHDYADAPAVEDAAREVRNLQRKGIRVGAVFMGPTMYVPAAEKIYGKSLARIRTMDQLAVAAGRLIAEEIRALE